MKESKDAPTLLIVAKNSKSMIRLKKRFASVGINVVRTVTPGSAFNLLPALNVEISVVDCSEERFPVNQKKGRILSFMKSSFPHARVIAMSRTYDVEMRKLAQEMGAVGYISLDMRETDIVKVVRIVLKGETWFLSSEPIPYTGSY